MQEKNADRLGDSVANHGTESPFFTTIRANIPVGVGVLDDPAENLTSMGKFYESNRCFADGMSGTPSPTSLELRCIK